MRWLRHLALVALVFAMLTGCGGNDDASTGDEEIDCEITFAGDLPDEPSGHRIYCINADGSGLHPLTNAADEAFSGNIYEALPSWSPDGSRVAFIRSGPDGGVFVANADGSNETRVIDGYAYRIDWSPDGSRLTFGLLAEGLPSTPDQTIAYELVVIDADGSNLLNISDRSDLPGEKTSDTFPLWSPDGTQILFHHSADTTPRINRNPQSGLYIIDADGSNPRQVDTGGVKVFLDFPENTWTPDGKSLTIRGGSDSDNPGAEGIYRIPLDGSPPVRLTPAEHLPAGTFDWSPEGNRLAYVALVRGDTEPDDSTQISLDLFIFEANSGTVERVIETPETLEAGPLWSPDGERLLYTSFPGGSDPNPELLLKNFRFAVMNTDGTNITIVVDGYSVEQEPWGPVWRSGAD